MIFKTLDRPNRHNVAYAVLAVSLVGACAMTTEYSMLPEADNGVERTLTEVEQTMTARDVALKYLTEGFRDEGVFDLVVADDYTLHFAGEESAVTGRAAVKAWNQEELFSGLPDVIQTVELLVVDGPLVAARVRYQGTHTGVFAGLEPTGRSISVPANMILRIEDGRVAEEWTESNQLAWIAQLTEE